MVERGHCCSARVGVRATHDDLAGTDRTLSGQGFPYCEVGVVGLGRRCGLAVVGVPDVAAIPRCDVAEDSTLIRDGEGCWAFQLRVFEPLGRQFIRGLQTGDDAHCW